MKEISKMAKLSRAYTNHCIRVTAKPLWSEAGLSDRHGICHVSDPRYPNSLQQYNSRPSSSQPRKCSDVLSSAVHKLPIRVIKILHNCSGAKCLLQWSKNTAIHHHQLLPRWFSAECWMACLETATSSRFRCKSR